MNYICIKWKHSVPSDPVIFYLELDEQRFEVRRVEIYADGRYGFASKTESIGGAGLGELRTQSLNAINADPVFEASEITRQQFEQEWSKRPGQGAR